MAVQKFQIQLNQQLEVLHKTVAASVTQQQQQLKDMEEDMLSFVSTKKEVRCIIYTNRFLKVKDTNLCANLFDSGRLLMNFKYGYKN